MERPNLLIITTLGFMLTVAESMRFDLLSGNTKCISEDIKGNAMTVGKYTVVNPNEGYPVPDTHKVTVRVTSPFGNNYHHGDHADSGHFAFTAAEAGDYTACFWAPAHKPEMTVTVEFEWKSGVAAKDWSKLAKKGKIEGMELELKKLFDTVTAIHEEMFYLRAREEEMQQLNRSTNSKMAGLSFLSLVNCVSMSHLKQIHALSFVAKLQNHHLVLAKILRFTAVSPSGDLSYAHRLFDKIPQPNTFLYNTLIRGYAKSLYPSYSVNLFNQMRRSRVDPDEYSFNFLIKARSRVRASEVHDRGSGGERDEIHGATMERDYGVKANIEHYGCVINMLGQAGQLDKAYELTDSLPIPGNEVVWEALLTACRTYCDVVLAERVVKKLSELRPDDEVRYYNVLYNIYVAAGRTAEVNEVRSENHLLLC
ncbi:hypothetical protein Tsubulata_010553 [Turnera subulata]|uniref:GOLD domain-containing protein n=1 Tax=Turnera subulata TaxID=218843 RepID=A0A9Q0FPR1_9ROSI|nr:hypothetical protein Tsubulata_010553 [Turnera subulata]